MRNLEFQPLDLKATEVKSFDCGKDAINTYLRRYAARNMTLNVSRTYVLLANDSLSRKAPVAAYYTLAHNTLYRESLPDPKGFPRYPLPVILLAQLGVGKSFQGRHLGTQTLIQALRHAYRIAIDPEGIPAIGVILDVLDQDALAFYQSFAQFQQLSDNPLRLFVPMASLATL